MPQQENSTANVVMIILLVIVVGLVVWFFTRGSTNVNNESIPENNALEINLGGEAGQSSNP